MRWEEIIEKGDYDKKEPKSSTQSSRRNAIAELKMPDSEVLKRSLSFAMYRTDSDDAA